MNNAIVFSGPYDHDSDDLAKDIHAISIGYEEALRLHQEIMTDMENLRSMAGAMRQKIGRMLASNGYRVLGYKDWPDYIINGLGKGRATAYNWLRTIEFELYMNGGKPEETGIIPERVVRQLSSYVTTVEAKVMLYEVAEKIVGRSPTTTDISKTVGVLAEAISTGTLMLNDGKQIPIMEAIADNVLSEIAESVARQRQHMIDNSNRKYLLKNEPVTIIDMDGRKWIELPGEADFEHEGKVYVSVYTTE